jgi:hypothetical protein
VRVFYNIAQDSEGSLLVVSTDFVVGDIIVMSMIKRQVIINLELTYTGYRVVEIEQPPVMQRRARLPYTRC